MGKGKIAVQVLHGEVFYMERILYNHEGDFKSYSQWRYEDDELMKKIVLKASEEEMNRLYQQLEDRNIWSFKVFDRGLTQLDYNSFTCLVVEPIPEETSDKLFGHLKLL